MSGVTMFVKHVTSNAKGGIDCDLGPKTLVFGPNASGKTAVVNAIELALSGRASAIYGREEVGKESDLIAHLAPGRKGELYSQAFLDNGQQVTWKAGGKGGKKAAHLVPPCVDVATVFPLRGVLDAVRGNADTARKFFLGFAVGAIKDTDVLARIPDSLHQYYRRTVLKAGAADAPVDKLLLALECAKKEKRAANERAKASKAASADAAQGLAPLPTDEAVKALQQQLKVAKERCDTLKASQAAAGALERTRVQYAALKEQVAAAEAEFTRAQAALAEAEAALVALPKPAVVGDEFKNLMAVIDWHLGCANDYCRVCGRDASPELFEARQKAARDFVSRVQNEGATYLHAQGVRDAAKLTFATAEDRRATLHTQAQAMANALSSATAGGGPDPQAIEAAQAEVDKLTKALGDVDVLKAQWSASKRADENGNEASEEANRWDKLADACTDAIAKLLDTGIMGFQQRVQAALPPTDLYRLAVRDGQKAIFQFGLEKSGILYTALSGAEWARVIAAMADVCSPPEDKLAVVIPPPGEFEANTLTGVLNAFSTLRAQVVIATPVFPSKLPDGWTVIDTTKEQHRGNGAVQVQVPAEPVKAAAAVVPEPAPEPLPAPSEEPIPATDAAPAVVAEPGVVVGKPATW